MSEDFIELARAAFDPLADEVGFEFDGQLNDTWFAWVRWTRGVISLRVSDDRRDRLIEVAVSRPIADNDEMTDVSELIRGRDLVIPLWAIVESRGGTTAYDYSGERRLERLASYANAARTYATDFLLDPQAPVGLVVAVMRQRIWEQSDDGRAARRLLP